MEKMKLRTIITQDAEVDDQNSLRHFLFYANEVGLQGHRANVLRFSLERRTWRSLKRK